MNRISGVLGLLVPCAMFFATVAPAAAQEAWKPTRPVTLIAPNAPGGTSDRTAREMQRILQMNKLVEGAVVVVNRPGGSGTVALNQLVTHPGDGHVLMIGTGNMIGNHITGLSPHAHGDFTVLALMMEDYYGVNVRSAHPVQSAREMLDRLKKTPDSLVLGTSSPTGANFTTLAVVLKRGGVDVKRLKVVNFAGGGQSTMALLGGHVDIVSTGLSNMSEHLQQGRMRTLAVSAPRRRPGIFSGVPTWKEVGVDVTVSAWRAVMAPKDLTPAQIAYWDGVFRKLVATEDWKKEVAENYWENTYLPAAEARRRLDHEYNDTKQIMLELGIVK
ncbi:MAG TPA: tripartite tricarboxylate transporter substrate binding protein [Burkholderiales bacterium]|nr:tripartite tricarboxylate transporter substrate binding protein [Burkholderiales bacterium]